MQQHVHICVRTKYRSDFIKQRMEILQMLIICMSSATDRIVILQVKPAIIWFMENEFPARFPQKKTTLFPIQSAYPHNRKRFSHMLCQAHIFHMKCCLKKRILAVITAIDIRLIDLCICRNQLCCRPFQTILCNNSDGAVEQSLTHFI